MSSPSPSPFVLSAVDGTVTAYVRATGEVAWTFRVPDGKMDCRHVTRIHADEHRVVVVAARMNESGLFATVDGTAHVCCLEYATGKALWNHAVKGEHNIAHFTATLLVDGGQVFVVHGGSMLVFALETGKLMWQRRVERALAKSMPVSVSLAVPGLAQQGDAK
jgi:outer membrane protein assembly factor BamB